jgi:hypothetical protein
MKTQLKTGHASDDSVTISADILIVRAALKCALVRWGGDSPAPWTPAKPLEALQRIELAIDELQRQMMGEGWRNDAQMDGCFGKANGTTEER